MNVYTVSFYPKNILNFAVEMQAFAAEFKVRNMESQSQIYPFSYQLYSKVL